MTLPTDAAAPFGRVLTAMVTPFAPDGSLDLAAATELADELVAHGNDGLVINGTTGESPTTSDEEKQDLLRAVIEAVGDRACVVAGVGTNSTAHTLELARQAAAAGADGLLVVTPYYSKPPQAALVSHFCAVADATELPVMLYDIPGRSGVRLAADTLLRLAEHPRILANKDAAADPFAASVIMSASGLVYYSGDDGLNLPLLSVGAAGFVSVVGHVVGDRLAAMHAAYRAGDVVRAREINDTILPAITAIMTHTQGAIATKAALEMLERPGGGPLRAPLASATPAERELIAAGLREAGVLR
jgi:4-hydroxy-tetrahydrodipicolinate synthase